MAKERVDLPGELSSTMRTSFHDLRNFFAVVGAAQRMLMRDIDENRLRMIAEALQVVARDGIALTTQVLGQSEDGNPAFCDPGDVLRDLQVLLVPLAGPRMLIRVETDNRPIRVAISYLDLQAITLEIVSNSLAAEARRIRLRGRTVGNRYWVIGIDDGHGCELEEVWTPFIEAEAEGAHGTGLKRIVRSLHRAGGAAKMRSRPNQGCAIGFAIPIVTDSSVCESKPEE
ncbi:sensor histidine kinase [Qipengyuania spongiae]|uniref:Sensor histidine kinase n=1 Tax=Qipengyuania spongiae TaxID=2909673 RepID=A0ABY5T2M0_9SPHN|nr:ATP-binding protein [Qipengyuania spongiae]UVI39586.1 hypothetical protein L1F33_01060 [Qipengyuania spongiae]